MDRNVVGSPKKVAVMVALRKESVDRNVGQWLQLRDVIVALRKESVDRNTINKSSIRHRSEVALRKESVDRNKGLIHVVDSS